MCLPIHVLDDPACWPAKLWCCSIFSQWRALLPKTRVIPPSLGLNKIKILLNLRATKKQDKQISRGKKKKIKMKLVTDSALYTGKQQKYSPWEKLFLTVIFCNNIIFSVFSVFCKSLKKKTKNYCQLGDFDGLAWSLNFGFHKCKHIPLWYIHAKTDSPQT